MPRKRGKDKQGGVEVYRPNYYETSSPFETFVPDLGKPEKFSGLIDNLDLPRRLMTGPSGPAVQQKFHAEQFDNPRGYPGLAMVTTGAEKSKIPFGKKTHSIYHAMENEGKLPKTEKP